MQIGAWIALALISTTVASAQTQIQFCDLLRNSEAYNGKKVVVRATYRYGYEWQQTYCLNCLEKGKAWLELPSDLDNKSLKSLKHAPKGAGIVNITVRGTFISGGHYGHLNGYSYKLVADG